MRDNPWWLVVAAACVGCSNPVADEGDIATSALAEPPVRLLGEAATGWLTRVAIGAGEGFAFGAGLAFGLTHRPR